MFPPPHHLYPLSFKVNQPTSSSQFSTYITKMVESFTRLCRENHVQLYVARTRRWWSTTDRTGSSQLLCAESQTVWQCLRPHPIPFLPSYHTAFPSHQLLRLSYLHKPMAKYIFYTSPGHLQLNSYTYFEYFNICHFSLHVQFGRCKQLNLFCPIFIYFPLSYLFALHILLFAHLISFYCSLLYYTLECPTVYSLYCIYICTSSPGFLPLLTRKFPLPGD